MENRKVFNDSVTPLPDEQGITAHGLMVNAARPEDQEQPMQVLFSLEMPAGKEAELEKKIAAGEVVAPGELKSEYSASPEDTGALVSWLKGEGFKDIEVSPNGTSVYATARASQLEKSLRVNMVRVTREGITYTAAKNAPSLPAEVSGNVHAIIGLQPFRHANKHRMHPTHKRANRVAITTSAGAHPVPNIQNAPPYLVGEILGAYNASGLPVTGRGQTIAILIDTFPKDADLAAFWSQNHLPVNPGRVVKINVGGGPLPPAEGEETLDAQWTSGIAPGADIRIYASGSLAFVDLDKALDRILDDLGQLPTMRQLSISLGLGEQFMGGVHGEAATQHQKFLRLAAAGVNVFVSSGDAGSNPDSSGQNPTGPLQVEYASSDPCVVGVGGTTLVIAADGSVTETGWVNGGGGKSAFFKRPAWQKGPGIVQGTDRLVPDVSLAADPNQGALVILDGSPHQIGGTSWSAPVWAGFCALINEARLKAGKPMLPFLNPLLYPLIGSPAFRDVLEGSNGEYKAAGGYDLVTGIGVPDMKMLIKALS